MAQITLEGPDSKNKEFNIREYTKENGKSPKELVDSLNTMFASMFGGAAEIDFGAFPGGYDASVTVSSQTEILASSQVRAWLVATETDDHSVDEHRVDPPIITVGNIVAGSGFTIYAIPRGVGPAYGKWTVQYSWL